MADKLSKADRSALMARVRREHTHPERVVRSFLHKNGFRFRLHAANLPGRPDIVLPRYRSVIFVHGCFWHRHRDCVKTTTPSANRDFWEKKFAENMARDLRNQKKLTQLGWSIVTVWECETGARHLKQLISRLRRRTAHKND